MPLADAPATWPDQPSISTLEALLFFGGIPLLAVIVIALLVMAPSLAKGPRYRAGQEWDSEPERLGAMPAAQHAGAEKRLGASAAAPSREQSTSPTADRLSDDDSSTGGASVTW